MAGGPKGQRFLRPAGCFLLGVLTLGWVCHTARAQDLPCAASIPMPPVLYVFGDSQFDVGNTNFIQADRANYFPYGKDFVPASGRFSNGRVIPDCIGAAPDWPPKRSVSGLLPLASGVFPLPDLSLTGVEARGVFAVSNGDRVSSRGLRSHFRRVGCTLGSTDPPDLLLLLLLLLCSAVQP